MTYKDNGRDGLSLTLPTPFVAGDRRSPPSFVAVPRATRLPSCFHWRTI